MAKSIKTRHILKRKVIILPTVEYVDGINNAEINRGSHTRAKAVVNQDTNMYRVTCSIYTAQAQWGVSIVAIKCRRQNAEGARELKSEAKKLQPHSRPSSLQAA